MYYLTQAGVNFLNEVKSSVEHEKAIRAKETKGEKGYQDFISKMGDYRTPMDSPKGKADKANYPEDYPPHTTDPDSPEQFGQKAGIKAGVIRHKRLKKIASQTPIDKFSRKIKRGVKRAVRSIRIPDTARGEGR